MLCASRWLELVSYVAIQPDREEVFLKKQFCFSVSALSVATETRWMMGQTCSTVAIATDN